MSIENHDKKKLYAVIFEQDIKNNLDDVSKALKEKSSLIKYRVFELGQEYQATKSDIVLTKLLPNHGGKK